MKVAITRELSRAVERYELAKAEGGVTCRSLLLEVT